MPRDDRGGADRRDRHASLAMTELSLAMKSPGERFGPVAAGQFTFEILPNNGKLCYKYLVHSPARTTIIQGGLCPVNLINFIIFWRHG